MKKYFVCEFGIKPMSKYQTYLKSGVAIYASDLYADEAKAFASTLSTGDEKLAMEYSRKGYISASKIC